MRLMFVGDVNLGEYYPSFGHGPATFAEANDIFAGVSSTLGLANVVAGNLEASITDLNLDSSEPESMVLRASPAHAKQFKSAGFRILQVANNHSVQHGDDAFEQSVAIAESLGIAVIGLKDQEPVTISESGLTVGFLAASDVPDNTDKEQQHYQRLDDSFDEIVRRTVKSVDHLIVMLHWGLEASTVPLPYQRELAAKYKEYGVRAIVGSHPHLFYEVERDGDFVCAYSLGNFVFDLCWDTRLLKSGILDIELDSASVRNAKVWPVRITKNGCFPVNSGDPAEIVDTLRIYDLGSNMKWQQIKKLIYFFKNIFAGKTDLKLKFIARKFRLL
tara:strand:+ start:143 stop:1135 length:993 start_codon:yes stop_codon:yes gene_type:complete